MNEVPRFQPRVDPRPADSPWPMGAWPIEAGLELVGATVALRAFDPMDTEEMFAALDHDQVWTHVAGRPSSAAELSQLLSARASNPNWHVWTVRLVREVGGMSAGSIIGTSSYLETVVEAARTEIGGTLYSPQVWASTVNPECKLLLLTHAFESMHMGRVQLMTDIRNMRSQQAIARLGAQFEGVLRRYQRRQDGSVRDSVLFSIVAEDWPEVRARLERRL
ncbi:MAG: GNAT family protein [Actinomycetota bacterium]|nr:GNAT family protein [Actinomycetota bacterium]